MINIIYPALPIAHARTNRKDNIFMQRRLVQNFTFILEWGQGTCSLTKHTPRWAYSRYFSPACCLLRFASFFEMGLTSLPPIWTMSLSILFIFFRVPLRHIFIEYILFFSFVWGLTASYGTQYYVLCVSQD